MASLFDNIMADADFIATYTENEKFLVTWKDWDGRSLKTETVYKGKNATPPTNPTREGYTFTGWDNVYSNVTSDLTITAQFSLVTYTIKWLNWDGSLLKEEKVEKGKHASPPDTPTRDGYIFSSWSSSGENINSDLEITALYTEHIRKLEFSLYDWKTKTYESKDIYKNAIPILHQGIGIREYSGFSYRPNEVKLKVELEGKDVTALCTYEYSNPEEFKVLGKGHFARYLKSMLYADSSYERETIKVSYDGLEATVSINTEGYNHYLGFDFTESSISGTGWYKIHICRDPKKLCLTTEEQIKILSDLRIESANASGKTVYTTKLSSTSMGIYKTYFYEVYIPASSGTPSIQVYYNFNQLENLHFKYVTTKDLWTYNLELGTSGYLKML